RAPSTRLKYLARGGDKVVYEADDMILKISNVSQSPEVRFAGLLPKLTASTHWQEKVIVKLHQEDGDVLHTHNLFMTCQDKVQLAAELLAARGETFSFKFLAYVGCLLTFVSSLGITARDTEASNLGIRLQTAADSHPEAVFFDTLSWVQSKKVNCRWVGWLTAYEARLTAQEVLKDGALSEASLPSLQL
ncbi:unnamed protein product, partial [Symbiodinium necroappetens]